MVNDSRVIPARLFGHRAGIHALPIGKIRERHGLASGTIEYRPELWAEEEQLDLFPLQ